MTQVVIPISENTKYFPESEYFFPKPLLEVSGLPMIVQVIKQIHKNMHPSRLIFIVPKALENQYSISNILRLNSEAPVTIVERSGPTSGALCSVLLAIDEINLEEPLVILNSDEIINDDLYKVTNNFININTEGGIVTFNSSHPRWCFADLDENNNVTMCQEKKVLSNYALAGYYFFKTGSLFFQAAEKAMQNDDKVNNLFYLSAAINQIILSGGKVLSHKISKNNYFTLFSPETINEFEKSEFSSLIRKTNLDNENKVNIVIPSARK